MRVALADLLNVTVDYLQKAVQTKLLIQDELGESQ